MEEYFSTADWTEYKVLVHGLKSSSKTVGDNDLSEEARLLEEASKAEDVEYITTHHAKLLEDFKASVEKVTEVL